MLVEDVAGQPDRSVGVDVADAVEPGLGSGEQPHPVKASMRLEAVEVVAGAVRHAAHAPQGRTRVVGEELRVDGPEHEVESPHRGRGSAADHPPFVNQTCDDSERVAVEMATVADPEHLVVDTCHDPPAAEAIDVVTADAVTV